MTQIKVLTTGDYLIEDDYTPPFQIEESITYTVTTAEPSFPKFGEWLGDLWVAFRSCFGIGVSASGPYWRRFFTFLKHESVVIG